MSKLRNSDCAQKRSRVRPLQRANYDTDGS
jgi:hypothetical protein